ncbi:MAG: ATP-binding cassette domain-containing protein, partial [Bacilli bacterium]|nr:ATP-binding cassette domain-containing protein [Bacilli bacterium]
MKNVIEIKDLKKVYPKFTLDIDKLNIPSGEVTGLIGENGAGKTTLIKLLLNVINKSSGSIKIFNKDLDKEE